MVLENPVPSPEDARMRALSTAFLLAISQIQTDKMYAKPTFSLALISLCQEDDKHNVSKMCSVIGRSLRGPEPALGKIRDRAERGIALIFAMRAKDAKHTLALSPLVEGTLDLLEILLVDKDLPDDQAQPATRMWRRAGTDPAYAAEQVDLLRARVEDLRRAHEERIAQGEAQ